MRAVGDLATYMADHASSDQERAEWNDGGTYKVVLHGLVGAATAALGGGNALQGALGGTAGEAASSAMQEYLRGQGIDPNSPTGKTLMQLGSTAVGAAVGGGNGAVTSLQGEQFNRELHQTEKDRIHELAGGDQGEEASLSAAACALVHCSAQYAEGTPEYAYYSQLEAIGSQPQYSEYRTLLSQQTYTRMGVNSDGKATPVTEGLFDYDVIDKGMDATSWFNNNYGHPITRAGGALQAIGGIASAATGGALAVGGAAACPESLGGGCGVAAGGMLLAGWGIDQTQAGSRTVWSGVTTPTFGGQAIQNAFGISPGAAELLYGALGTVGSMNATSALLSARGASSTIDAGITWGQGIQKQGMPWENYLTKQLPAGAQLPPNFKTFDFYDVATQTATSAKTLDTTTAARVANPQQIYSSMKGNIDTVATFDKPYTLSGVTVDPAKIVTRELQVAVPTQTTALQWAQINKAIQYGASQGVKVVVTPVKGGGL